MDNNEEETGILRYHGCNFLKQRLVLSILSGKPVEIKNIRPPQGLQEFEVCFYFFFSINEFALKCADFSSGFIN